MRLARVTVAGRDDFAVSDGGGPWVPLGSLGLDLADTPAVVEQWSRVRAALGAGRGRGLDGRPPLRCPVLRPSKVLAIGLNYADHIRETGAEAPERPIVFAKFPNALSGPHDAIVVDPELTGAADYESELVVVIGRRLRRVGEADALAGVFGYAVGNDVSARDWQRRDGQISRSKSYDTFCPLGPWITTAEEVGDPQALGIRSEVNGERRQDSTTAEMVFPVAALVAFLSRTMTLEPGDVLLTGTPPGVGMAADPPTYLRPGDVVACEIDRLGRIENPVVGPDGQPS